MKKEMLGKIAIVAACIMLAVFTSCKKDESSSNSGGGTGGGTTTLAVTTSPVTDITQTAATCGGNVTDDGGYAVTLRGVCWSTSQNPTVADSHTTDGSGTGIFTSSITGLTAGTTYYVRAYAINEHDVKYGEQKSFTTETGGSGGGLGTFSVSDTKQVKFSQGNLQYQASTDTWRFAENQYDCIGNANSNISSSYSGWIDLFGWGTSGWNNGNEYYQPYNTETDGNWEQGYGYGPTNETSDLYNLTGAYANSDWGVYNAISNGGNQARIWRTLTNDEWFYLFNTRTDASSKYSQATVNNVHGLVILPDSWILPSGVTFTAHANNWTSNNYSISQWSSMESAGAVFLPAAGYRDGTSVFDVGAYGYYWSSSYHNEDSAYYMYFYSGTVNPSSDGGRYIGQSVRLVADY